jgi:hypothetical protein
MKQLLRRFANILSTNSDRNYSRKAKTIPVLFGLGLYPQDERTDTRSVTDLVDPLKDPR